MQSVNHLITAVRAIVPGIPEVRMTGSTTTPMCLLLVTALDKIESHSSNNIGKDQNPADRWNTQEVMNHTIANEQRPEITKYYPGNRHQAGDHKPGLPAFLPKSSHFFTNSGFFLHQGQ